MKFSLLRPPDDPRWCQIHKLPGDVKDMSLPSRGKTMEGRDTAPRDFRMSDAAKGIQVPDAIANAFNFLMASEALKQVIERHAKGARIEYLPFRLLNHKGRVALERGSIVNPLGTVDCIDRERSRGVETAIYPGEYVIARQLTLRDDALPRDASVFRGSLFPPGVWVRDDLRAEIERAGLKVRFVASGEDL